MLANYLLIVFQLRFQQKVGCHIIIAISAKTGCSISYLLLGFLNCFVKDLLVQVPEILGKFGLMQRFLFSKETTILHCEFKSTKFLFHPCASLVLTQVDLCSSKSSSKYKLLKNRENSWDALIICTDNQLVLLATTE